MSVAKDFPRIVVAEEPKWKDSIRGSNAVVNLAGMPISTRWSSEVSMAGSLVSSFLYFRLLEVKCSL